MKNSTRIKKSAKKHQDQIDILFTPIWNRYKDNFDGHRERDIEYFNKLEDILLSFRLDIIDTIENCNYEHMNDDEYVENIVKDSKEVIKAINTIRYCKNKGKIPVEPELIIVSLLKTICTRKVK